MKWLPIETSRVKARFSQGGIMSDTGVLDIQTPKDKVEAFRHMYESGLRDFRGLDFSGQWLSRVIAKDCDFTGSSFQGAMLSVSDFSSRNFTGANLKRAKAVRVNFEGSDFTDAKVKYLDFRDCKPDGKRIRRYWDHKRFGDHNILCLDNEILAIGYSMYPVEEWKIDKTWELECKDYIKWFDREFILEWATGKRGPR